MNVTKQLYQWDTGQKLTECTGIYVDYLISDEVYRVEIIDGTCIIPDELLQTSGRYKVWECMADNTLREFAFKVLPRPIPPNYVFTPTEQLTFEGLVQKETNKFNTNAIEKLNAYNANADNRVAEFNAQTGQIQADVSELKSDLVELEEFTREEIVITFEGEFSVVGGSDRGGNVIDVSIPEGTEYTLEIVDINSTGSIPSINVYEVYGDDTQRNLGAITINKIVSDVAQKNIVHFSIWTSTTPTSNADYSITVSYKKLTTNSLEERVKTIETRLPKEICWNREVKPPYWVFHLDCGRKYFTVDNIKLLIDKISVAGFNQMQLHFSENGGFRFALNDMIVTVDGNTYDLTPCLGGVETSNDNNYLTESDMNTIISYAFTKDIDIVPSFDMPGHMGRILWKFPQFKYSGSNETLNILDENAIKFAKAITDKYSKYFTGRGCSCWNIGCDEIVNDNGFQTIYENGNYDKVVNFVNGLADVVKKNGLKPRIFNEAVYYNNDYKYYISKDIEVMYWYTDWDKFLLPDKLQRYGYKLINTSYKYYWILGESKYKVTEEYLNNTDLLKDFYNQTITKNGYGATLCVWCDEMDIVQAGDGGTGIVESVSPIITAFGNAITRSLIN